MERELDTRDEPGMRRSSGPAPGFSRADLHVHTTYSDGTMTPEGVLNFYALHSDVRVFAITDHDTMDGAIRAQQFARAHPDLFSHLDVIVGEEVSSTDGHVIGLFMQEWVPPGMSAADTVKAIHEQGAIDRTIIAAALGYPTADKIDGAEIHVRSLRRMGNRQYSTS